MSSFKLFGLKRELVFFCPDKGFFKLHSSATQQEKDEIWVKKQFFSQFVKI